MQGEHDLPLRDIHLPDPVSWWPPAPGWWFLAGITLLSFVALFIIKKRREKKLLHKAALVELETIYAQFERDANTVKLVRSLSVLLRRACISFYPRARTAGLTGKQWLQYLDATSDKKEFANGTGSVLTSVPYLRDNSRPKINATELRDLCESWLMKQPYKNAAIVGHQA